MTKDGDLKLAGGMSWSELAPRQFRRVAPSSPKVSKPTTSIRVRVRNTSVSMNAALWGISDLSTMMDTQLDTLVNDQAVRPPRAREAVTDGWLLD